MLKLSGLLALWQQIDEYRLLLKRLRQATAEAGERAGTDRSARWTRSAAITLGLLAPARPYLAAALAGDLRVPVFLLVDRPERAHDRFRQIKTWLPEDVALYHFPERRRLPFERVPVDRTIAERRVAVLNALNPATNLDGHRRGLVVIASVRAVLQHTAPVDVFRRHSRRYQVGETVTPRVLLRHWHEIGYRSTGMVVEPGTFSRRGGILDVFPAGDDRPARIEFFGDEIETIRRFDPATQRSVQNLEAVAVPPALESLPAQGPAAAERLAGQVLESLSAPARDRWTQDLERLREAAEFPEIDLYLPYLYPDRATVLDHLPQNALILVDDWAALHTAVADVENEAVRMGREAEVRGDLPPGFAADVGTWEDLEESLSRRHVCCLGTGPAAAEEGWDQLFREGPRYSARIDEVVAACREGIGKYRQVVVSRQAVRLAELMQKEGLQAEPRENVRELPPPGSLTLVRGAFPEGWVCEPAGGPISLVLMTDAEIFGWAPVLPRRPEKPRRTPSKDAFFTDLKRGDYVVHLEHGVGLFGGLVQRAINGVEREYLLIEYAAGDKLYVPVHQADRVSRYVGVGGQSPSIHRLGTADWETVKQKAKKAVAEIAEGLLDLYSRREVVTGHAFSPDTAWQAEMEAAFPYEETADQVRAIAEVKRDMESPRPMDRLVCGDVGYGKTEVALRAAFKAVMDGKQVAMLVPTTVLAQQHYNTFVQRLKPFPVEVEMLSRFRPPAEQKRILEQLIAGRVDIVIGTHRLLSSDVQFHDLGLLIVDEEQRFGVTHKERLKQMRTQVDVLTLTATPIPRTLHMALTGVRDMSTIDTPPEERLPIITQTSPYDKDLIRRAILKEMGRGGQVFFVHNRVTTIQAVAQHVQKLVPEARIAVAHGQMRERTLEKVMLDFAAGKYDVLVCTNIIESGLDMPNVNTIIIHRADWFGLAQLYQLRGRVGRGVRRAYAYLLHPRLRSLGESARQRIEAIREATQLGAGFRLAMRDLEIRGAGELLGARQHGHIAAVGFDLYTRLLSQAVAELKAKRKGEPVPPRRLLTTPKVDLPIPAYLPADYIPDAGLRLRIYQQLGEVTRVEQARDLAAEWADRFGPLPEPAQNLLYVLELRARAARAPIAGVGTEGGYIMIMLSNGRAAGQVRAQGSLRGKVRFGRREVRIPVGEDGAWRKTLLHVVRLLESVDKA